MRSYLDKRDSYFYMENLFNKVNYCLISNIVIFFIISVMNNKSDKMFLFCDLIFKVLYMKFMY